MTNDTDQKLKNIERALYSYHYALDLHQDADVAARQAIDKIQTITGKPRIPGAVLEKRRRHFTWKPGDPVIVEGKDRQAS